MTAPRHFYGTVGIDRAAHRRDDEGWLRARLRDPATRFVPVSGGRNLMRPGDPLAAALPGRERLEAVTGLQAEGLEAGAAGGPPPGVGWTGPVLLGVRDGAAHFAVDVTDVDRPGGNDGADGWCYRDLRRHGPLLEASDAGLLAYARAMVHWHRTHRFCGACGNGTRVERAGHLRTCPAAECGRQHFPRTDPAVIVRVLHDDRILLGRQGSWPADRRSVLAGFVEPTESLEGAVTREVAEEAGVTVAGVRYVGSQPWPFPASLMLGFVADATEDRLAPRDEELVDLDWWSRDRVRRERRDGSLRLPPETSISRWLIDGWLGGD